MSREIRAIAGAELEAFVAMLETGAGRKVTDAAIEDARGMYEPDRTLAVFEGGRMVAGTGSDQLELTVPGPATVPAARATLGVVLPTHRGRGLGAALMAVQLRDVRERGEPLMVGVTPEPAVKRRYGFAPSGSSLAVEIGLARGLPAEIQASPGAVRMLDEAELAGTLPGLFDRHRLRQPGQVLRLERFWRLWLLDRELFRVGSSGRFAVVYDDPAGIPQGYLTYRLEYGPLREQPVRSLVVEDLVSVTDEARRALWAYCLGFHQAVRVRAPNLPADEPVGWLLADPRQLRAARLRDFLVLRITDVAAALAARGYAVAGTLVLDVADDRLPENAGRYRLEGGPDGAGCARTGVEPDLALSVTELAAAYLGGTALSALARAGRVAEHRQGALARADAMFAAATAPWTVTDW